MTSISKSSKELSQTILSLPLPSQSIYDHRGRRYVLIPTSSEYRTSGNASWKIAVAWVDNKARVTLYCRRNSSSYALLAIYSVSLISTTSPYSGNGLQQGHASFSGPTLETTANFDLNGNSNFFHNMLANGNITLQMHITSLKPSADDMSVKLYKDAFCCGDNDQPFSESSPYSSDFIITFKDGKQVHVQKSPRTLKRFLKLAYKFQMPELLTRCDIFLMVNSAKFGGSKLLLLAQDYKLERLQAQCISEYKSIDDIKAIKDEPEYADLDDRTKRMLLDKIIGINSSVLSDASDTGCASHDLATNETRAAIILDKLASLSLCPSDIVLVVGNKQIRAHKQLLSFSSEFFDNMFHGGFKESHESEITVEEVCYEEMVELLSIVYPSGYTINETNIATIVKLADRFAMSLILERCKQELKNSSKVNGALKLWLAQRYDSLAELQEEFARECNSIEDLEKLKAEPEFGLLDDKMRALILESVTR